jgi:putative polyketide hydroxylase
MSDQMGEAMPNDEVPILIAGGGPAGLAAAVELARHGVEVLLVERKGALSGLPRATVISTRSMELLRSWGLADEILAGGIEVEWLMRVCTTLAEAASGTSVQVGLPTREQAAVLSPTAPACVPQDHLEPVLLRHLHALPGARVSLGTEVVGLSDEPDGVRAALRDVTTGATRLVHARYLVAADGAHSRIRAGLGIPMRGPDRLARSANALFHAPLWSLLGPHRYGIYVVTDPAAAGVFVPAGQGDRWVYAVLSEPDRADPAELTADQLSRRIRLGAGVADLRPRIERVGAFSFAAQLAEHFRQGNVFLVGDAAHRVSPRGGTGMNTAIHDGYDLGWKLAWVLRGWAGPDLLDSYESERRPVAEHNTTRSADPDGSRRAAEQEVSVDVGARIAHRWLPSTRVSTLDLLGHGLTLFTGPRDAPWRAAAAAVREPLPITVRSLDPITARAIGIHRDGALLVRPDGAPVAGWSHGTDARFAVPAAVRSVSAGGIATLAAA